MKHIHLHQRTKVGKMAQLSIPIEKRSGIKRWVGRALPIKNEILQLCITHLHH